MQKIYALIDKESIKKRGLSLKEVAEFLEKSNIKIAQYRNKNPKSKSEIEDDLRLIKTLFSGDLIINDYLEFIDLVDGIHLGQEDLAKIAPTEEAIKKVREKIGNKILGISTHNKDEILKANHLEIDYIGLGAYRSTSTKSDAKVSGEEILEWAKLSTHPVAIIGGVKLSDRFPSQIKMRVIGSDILNKIKEENEQI